MRVDLGAEVRTIDGQVVGKIKHLIMDANSGSVLAVVIEKGFLFTDDVEVRLEHLRYGVDDRIELDCTKEEYDRLPRFDRYKYSDRVPPNQVLAGFPPAGLLWYGASPVAIVPESASTVGGSEVVPPLAVSTETGSSADHVDSGPAPAVVDMGSSVYTSDDHQIGEVHEVTFDVSTGRPLVLVVRSGLIVHHDTQLPADLIQEVKDGEVRLSITLNQFKSQYSQPLRPAA